MDHGFNVRYPGRSMHVSLWSYSSTAYRSCVKLPFLFLWQNTWWKQFEEGKVLVWITVECSPSQQGRHGGRSIRWLVTLHLQSGSREREMETGAQFTVSFLFSQSRTPLHETEWCCWHLRTVFLPQLAQPRNSLTYRLILAPFKLILNRFHL